VRQKNSFSKSGASVEQKVFGGMPPPGGFEDASNFRNWAQTVPANPMPVKYAITSLDKLLPKEAEATYRFMIKRYVTYAQSAGTQHTVPQSVTGHDTALLPGKEVTSPKILASPNGLNEFHLGEDGNLKIINTGTKQVLWESKTGCQEHYYAHRENKETLCLTKKPYILALKPGGNLVLTDKKGFVAWESNTCAEVCEEKMPGRLAMLDSGELKLSSQLGTPMWSSGSTSHAGTPRTAPKAAAVIGSNDCLLRRLSGNFGDNPMHYHRMARGVECEGDEQEFDNDEIFSVVQCAHQCAMRPKKCKYFIFEQRKKDGTYEDKKESEKALNAKGGREFWHNADFSLPASFNWVGKCYMESVKDANICKRKKYDKYNLYEMMDSKWMPSIQDIHDEMQKDPKQAIARELGTFYQNRCLQKLHVQVTDTGHAFAFNDYNDFEESLCRSGASSCGADKGPSPNAYHGF